MAKLPSAGILLHRRRPDGTVEVLLGHMGGPLWRRRGAGAWTVPKGEYPRDEDALTAAYREFTEELGVPVPAGTPLPLGQVRQSGGKVVTAWALEADLDPAAVTTGTFSMEWPPGSGTVQDFPELDRVAWLDLDEARTKLITAQVAFLDRLVAAIEAPR